MDVVGPRANGEIISLAKQASADWVFGSDDTPEWREMRKFHSQQLKDEALRLCGTDENGETPSTCDVSFGDTDLPGQSDAPGLLARTVDAADKVPDDSVDLVIAQAIDALALTPVALDNSGQAEEHAAQREPALSPLSKDADIAAANAMLARENALYYGLGLALAYADPDLRRRIGELRESSHERTAALVEILPEEGTDGQPESDGADPAEALVPAAGYQFAEGFSEPTSLQEATALVNTMQSDLVKEWRRTAADAPSQGWMADAILLAAHAQRA